MGWIVRNWQLKIAAAALATVLYTGLVFSGSFTDARIGGVAIQRINQPSGAYVITQQLPTVEVHYRRSKDAIAPVTVDSFSVTVDLSKYDMQRPGQPQSIAVVVSSLASGVTVLDSAPGQVTVTLDVLASKEVDVLVDHGQVPPGLELGAATVSDQTVTARGPSSFVSQVARAEAVVAIDASGIDLHRQVDLRPVDANGNLVPSVELTPGVVTVDIAVDQQQTNKTVPVRAVINGAPAAGYQLGTIAVDPPAVTVRGTPSALALVNDIATDPISLGGLAASRAFTVKLVVPGGVQAADQTPATATVRVTIVPAQGSRTFLVGVTCTGTSAGSTCLPQVSQIAMTLSGPEPALAALKIAAITPTVDATGLGPGSHDVTPKVTLPSGISLVSFSPAQVTIVIQPAASPTPGP